MDLRWARVETLMNNAGCFSQNVARLAITDSKGAVCGRRQNWRESGLTLRIFEASNVLIELMVVWNLKCQNGDVAAVVEGRTHGHRRRLVHDAPSA